MKKSKNQPIVKHKNNSETLSYSKVIDMLGDDGIDVVDEEETFSNNSSYSGSFASLKDFKNIGWDTPY